MKRITVYVSGKVQGVGFRRWMADEASALGLTGYAKNLADGRVEVVAEGRAEDVDKVVDLFARSPGRVDDVEYAHSEATGRFAGFERC